MGGAGEGRGGEGGEWSTGVWSEGLLLCFLFGFLSVPARLKTVCSVLCALIKGVRGAKREFGLGAWVRSAAVVRLTGDHG